MKNITTFLNKTFPNVAVYPLLGNHDVYPVSQHPGAFDKYYADVLDKTGWHQFLTASQVVSFKQGFCSVMCK